MNMTKIGMTLASIALAAVSKCANADGSTTSAK
jgi:hypothetical protein